MPSAKLSVDFEEKAVEVRGKVYRFRELSANEYDEIIKLSTDENDNADLQTVLKLMVIKCCVDPKLTDTEFGALPMPVSRQLTTVVNKMHFSDITPKEVDVESPNGSTPAIS
jgi:hypothetical protein